MTVTAPLPVRLLGSSDVSASVVGLGANTFGPPRLDARDSAAVIHAALDLGVTFVDTALIYGGGMSEEHLGRALVGRRDEMVIATKFNLALAGEGSVRDRIVAQAETSLRRLGTDHIDLYQMHLPEPDSSIADVLSALDELVRAGKVRAVGACNFASWRLAEAASVAAELGTVSFVTVQNYYHLLARDLECEVAPWCRANGVSVLPYHPLGGGFLTGKYRPDEPPPEGSRGAAGSRIVDHMSTEVNHAALARLQAFCAERGRRVGELAIAWLLSNELVGSVIAGVSNVAQLEVNVGAASWVISDSERLEVDAILEEFKGRPVDPEMPPYPVG